MSTNIKDRVPLNNIDADLFRRDVDGDDWDTFDLELEKEGVADDDLIALNSKFDHNDIPADTLQDFMKLVDDIETEMISDDDGAAVWGLLGDNSEREKKENALDVINEDTRHDVNLKEDDQVELAAEDLMKDELHEIDEHNDMGGHDDAEAKREDDRPIHEDDDDDDIVVARQTHSSRNQIRSVLKPARRMVSVTRRQSEDYMGRASLPVKHHADDEHYEAFLASQKSRRELRLKYMRTLEKLASTMHRTGESRETVRQQVRRLHMRFRRRLPTNCSFVNDRVGSAGTSEVTRRKLYRMMVQSSTGR